jgi:hypothetical protein
MNHTDEQINLAGLLQPDDGPREFNSALDLQGEGIRVLGSGVQVDEENTGDCCAELEISESENNALTQENNALSAENEELQEQARFAGDTITLNSVAIFETEPNATISATITLTSAVDAGGGNYTYSFSYTYTTTSDGFIPQYRTASILRQGATVICIQIPVGGGSGSGTHQTTQAKTNQIEWTAHASYSSNCYGQLGSGYDEKGFILTGT